MEELLSNAHVYPDFYFLAFWQVIYDNVIAINVFFAWIKVLALTICIYIYIFFFLYLRNAMLLSLLKHSLFHG